MSLGPRHKQCFLVQTIPFYKGLILHKAFPGAVLICIRTSLTIDQLLGVKGFSMFVGVCSEEVLY